MSNDGRNIVEHLDFQVVGVGDFGEASADYAGINRATIPYANTRSVSVRRIPTSESDIGESKIGSCLTQ